MKVFFIAPNPFRTSGSDGYTQRVAAIDDLFNDCDKVYFDDVSGNIDTLVQAFATADIIYVHSIYQARHILTHFPDITDRAILDIHGAVPEELALTAAKKLADKYQRIEKRMFATCKHFVAVSESMIDHFNAKHSTSTMADWTLLPIFDAPSNSNNVR